MVFVVGSISVNGTPTGFRLLDLETVETEDVSKRALYSSISLGKRKVENIVIDKKNSTMHVINSTPLGIIEQKKLGDDESETISDDVTLVLAEVVEDGTDTVFGYLVANASACFAVYRAEEMVDIYAESNFKYAGITVENGQFNIVTETPLPRMEYSQVSEYLEFDEETAAEVADDTDTDVDNNFDASVEEIIDDDDDDFNTVADELFDTVDEIDTFDEVDSFDEDDTFVEAEEFTSDETEDVITDTYDDKDITDIDTEDVTDIDTEDPDVEDIFDADSDAMAVLDSVVEETEIDAMEDFSDDSTVTEVLDEAEIDMSDMELDFDVEDPETKDESINVKTENIETDTVDGKEDVVDMSTETVNDKTVNVSDDIDLDLFDDTDMFVEDTDDVLNELENASKTSANVTQQTTAIESTPVEETLSLDLSVENEEDVLTETLDVVTAEEIDAEYEDVTNKWRVVCNIDGVKTAAVFDADNTEMLKEWLTIPGVSVENGVLTRLVNEETLCDSFTVVEVNVPASIKAIDPYVFAYCKALQEVVINVADGVQFNVPSKLCVGCTDLTIFTVKGSVHTVGDFAFADCDALIQCDVPDIEIVEECAFTNCESFGAANILSADSLKVIGTLAFANSGPEAITFKQVETVHALAFADCNLLQRVVLNRNIVKNWSTTLKKLIDKDLNDSTVVSENRLHVFKGCNNLGTINIVQADIERLYDAYLSGTVLLES